jgi:hypothetical protein
MPDNSSVCPVCGLGATRSAPLPYEVTNVACRAQCGTFRVVTAFLPELAGARAGVGLLASRLDELSRALRVRAVTELVDKDQVLAALDSFAKAETTTE